MTGNPRMDTLLVIDDDESFRSLIQVVAEFHNVRCLEAPDCKSAIQLLKREGDRIKVLLLDYCLPGMTPQECAACLVKLVNPLTKIILVTAAVDAAERAHALGLKEWLGKPIELESVEELLRPSQ